MSLLLLLFDYYSASNILLLCSVFLQLMFLTLLRNLQLMTQTLTIKFIVSVEVITHSVWTVTPYSVVKK